MKTRDVWVVGGYALGTLLASAILFLPGAVTADGPAGGVATPISRPALTLGACDVVARVTPDGLQRGDKPSIEVRARNNGSEDARLDLRLALDVQGDPASEMSRRAPAPRRIWATSVALAVPPGETAVKTVETGVAVAGPAVALTVSQGTASVTMPEVAIAAPPPDSAAPGLVSWTAAGRAAGSAATNGSAPEGALVDAPPVPLESGLALGFSSFDPGDSSSPPAWVLVVLPLGLLAWFAAGRRRDSPRVDRFRRRTALRHHRIRR